MIWDGQGGTDVFSQNEIPYDPPNQASWMENPNEDGYPAFLVVPNLTEFHGYGMGSYCYFDVTDKPGEAVPPVQAAYAFESPDTPGVQWADLVTVSINGTGIIHNIINSTGGPTVIGAPGRAVPVPVDLVSCS